MYDMKNLAKLKNIEANAPEAMKAFVAFDKAAMAAGAIPVKYKELLALAVGFTTQAPIASRSTPTGRATMALPIRKSPRWSWSPQPCALAAPSPTALLP